MSIKSIADCPPTATELALVSAEARDARVDLVWSAPGASALVAVVQRRIAESDWADLATVTSDRDGRIEFSDADVVPGARYGYRLAVDEGGSREFSGEAWVSVPVAMAFALAPPHPSPSSGRATVSFSLPSAGEVRLEVLDVAGRALSTRDLSFGPGWHDVEATEAGALPAGVYFVRLSRLEGATGAARESRTTRLLIVRQGPVVEACSGRSARCSAGRGTAAERESRSRQASPLLGSKRARHRRTSS